MSTGAAFFALCQTLSADKRITVWHYRLYMTLFRRWALAGFPERIRVSRRSLMAESSFRNIVTYHKVMRELVEFGYILYEPSYDPFRGSEVGLLVPVR